ncbi:MAG TPA: ABC transporter permease, partial [Myxococcaceae bacterium]|nr:ABC transporter permease [Myxococcaceae bacterium]
MRYVDIPLTHLAIVFGFIVLAVAISRRNHLGLEGDLVWGALRGAAQLIAIGYLLLVLFNNERPAWVLLVLTVMLLVAAVTSARRVEHGPGRRILF